MATAFHNLSSYNPETVPNGSNWKIGIVISEWNSSITEKLLEGACNTCKEFGVLENNIFIDYVPGSFELTYGAKNLLEKTDVDAVIILGCVIQGETPHFTFVCEGVTQGITTLNCTYNIPVIFGLLTTSTLEQAEERAGGKLGNKGTEAAITALKMIALNKK
ncbi:MAG: 6,7-dimethyl-8-ribityllumazine synthase [Dysgonamonadaceae bacterium]|jgi:6,7-dimethyl-8-ribityllumazine synthase|nr:6,7-dimethyl-8-ribityllumazine synthase [Dysgonamonadaceae bacterium]MDD3308515.1 6,7-dimethyl-8-ribityllumazine synthase [Dysgonamonadaceae bacterium]MDD3899916.1 6,7-dimethyl-8-ribityllumazine synthase [Dysgonamonadaceae bacterium]MDD4398725.1 6,7-dimethyl-8-ribityllumazine synthase [Dysgonamonadaceae bacterium]MEA5081411.1 6,7-dimethyl-8-ribityllumazine synthase [Dysgonamonadaceae bacterium]